MLPKQSIAAGISTKKMGAKLSTPISVYAVKSRFSSYERNISAPAQRTAPAEYLTLAYLMTQILAGVGGAGAVLACGLSRPNPGKKYILSIRRPLFC